MSAPSGRIAFESVDVLIPVMNETISLEQTVDILLAENRADIHRLLVLVSPHTTSAAMDVVRRLRDQLGELMVVHQQTLPYLGGAIREGFALARASHVILMASDLETDPALVKTMIARAREHPDAMVTATRWRAGGGFTGYSRIKLACNWVFQKCISAIYLSSLSDLTFAYRIFPTSLVQAIRWEELRHPFLLETALKPLRLGTRIIETPVKWKARIEGESQNPFFRNFAYFRVALKCRFQSRQRILLPGRAESATVLPAGETEFSH